MPSQMPNEQAAFPSPTGAVKRRTTVKKSSKISEAIAIGLGIVVSVSCIAVTFIHGGRMDKRALSERGLLAMQGEASRSVEDFWGNFFRTDSAAEGELRSMLDEKLIRVMAAYGDAACKGKEGPCGFARMTRELAEKINKAADGADQVGCEMHSNRLEFLYICPHTGKQMYRIHRNRRHSMSGACVFETKQTLKPNYTPVRSNVTLDWNVRKGYWKVSQFSVMLNDAIVTVNAKGVNREKIFR